MRRLTVHIEASAHTCSKEAGQWCRFARGKGVVGSFSCHLFEKPLTEVTRTGKPSKKPAWLGRLPECKAAELPGWMVP